MDKLRQAQDIIIQFIDWFNYHKFAIDDELRDKIAEFTGGLNETKRI